MEKFLHKLFVANNKIDASEFSEPLQRKLKIFEKKLSLLRKLKGDDRTELYLDMEELDQELLQDILDEMEDRLENNDVLDEPDALRKDEQLLDSLWQSGKTRDLSRSFLKGMGIRTLLTGWRIIIGKYTLYRTAVFSYVYTLKKQK